MSIQQTADALLRNATADGAVQASSPAPPTVTETFTSAGSASACWAAAKR